jgi:hypothetical protein
MRAGTRIRAQLFTAICAILLFNSVCVKKNEETSQPSSTEALKSLPYLTWVPAEKDILKSGVTKYDRERSFEGLNLFNPRNLSRAYLMDMEGKVLHSWARRTDEDDGWQHVELCENGDLLAIVKDRMLIRLNENSDLVWSVRMRFHHDVALAENQDIYSLIREDDFIPYGDSSLPILNDYVVVLSPEGEIKRKISLFQVMKEEIPSQKWREINNWMKDPKTQQELILRKKKQDFLFTNMDPNNILHTNTVEIVGRKIKSVCRKGDLLVCCLKLDLIGIIDRESEKLIWKWGTGILDKPHHPTLLRNGNILIFDNGADRGYSRVVELDPIKKEIVWYYQCEPPEAFFSVSRGSSQRLPNGNTLITESDKGKVFEVTHSGEVVWEFYNPEVKKADKRRAAIYRMMRLTNSKKYPFLR